MTTRRPFQACLLALALVPGLAACGGDDEGDESQVATETSGPGQKTEGTPLGLTARLSGTEEVPGPGVKDGVGSVTLEVSAARGACYDLNVTMGEKPVQAHVHKGVKGASGPVIVNLSPTFRPGESAFRAEGCVGPVPDEVIAGLAADPAGHYVNVHSDAHPDGAMRGQLAKL